MATVPVSDTWAAGEKPSAAKMNKNIRDAINFVLNPPSMKAHQGTPQNATSAVTLTVTLDTEDWDTDALYAPGGAVTIVTPGLYSLQASVAFAANATGWRQVSIANNGVDLCVVRAQNVGSGSPTYVNTATTARMATGDVLTLKALHTAGVTLATVPNGSSGVFLVATWVGI